MKTLLTLLTCLFLLSPTVVMSETVKYKNLDAGTPSMNHLVNEGLKMVRDAKMQEKVQQRKRRQTLSQW